MKAYWFEPADGKLGYGDGRKPIKGRTHKVKCKPVLCKSGLHASASAFDALQYASSNNLWLVELGGEIVHGWDKSAATERTYIKRIDTEDVCFSFARRQALSVIHLWDAPKVVVDYLNTGDESLRAAAWAAAWAANSAARAARAAESAVWAANSAVWAARAAESAVWAAAWAAESAAWDAESAAWDAAKKDFDSAVAKAFGEH